MLTRLKERVELVLATEARLLHKMGLTPTQISFLGILLALSAGLCIWASQFNRLFLLVASIAFMFSGVCDILDGAVARLHNESTIYGGFIDSLLDRYAEAFVLVAIIVSGQCDVLWGSIALVGSLLVSYTRARAEATGAKMESIGVAERAERVIILVVAILATLVWQEALSWSIVILAILANATVLQRAVHFYKIAEPEKT
jgi:archaetidylinositol phosphate synthase